MDNKVQLKEEDFVNGEVVTNDIYPNTDTASVKDIASGQPMDVTLEHLWETINNKLTRVVNSVNGKSGPVVLDASDVGLGNVDNVSFAEMKQWMIDRFEAEFEAHRIRTFDSLDDVDRIVIGQNDRSYENSAFFATRGHRLQHTDPALQDQNVDDNRSFIGCFYFDYGTQQMHYSVREIKVVGKTDESLTYSNNETDGGLLKVHIHKDEKALYLHEGVSSNDSGLRINGRYLGGKTYMFYGAYRVYDNWNLTKPNDFVGNIPIVDYPFETSDNDSWASGFIVRSDASMEDKGHDVVIYINGTSMGTFNLYKPYDDIFVDNDNIICFFNPYIDSTTGAIMSGLQGKLMNRQIAMGRCEWVNDELHVSFRTLSPYVAWGLTNHPNHNNADNPTDSELSVEFSSFSDNSSASPINVLSNPLQWRHDTNTSMYPDNDPPTAPDETLAWVTIPEGIRNLFSTGSASTRKGGMFVQTDMSLCVMPLTKYGSAKGTPQSKLISNWGIVTPYPTPNETYDGYMHSSTFLGVNLAKGVVDPNKLIPLSGLVTMGTADSISDLRASSIFPKTEEEIFNMMGLYYDNTDDNTDRARLSAIGINFSDIDTDRNVTLTGGLMINPGTCLEVFPGDRIPDNGKEYYQQGKVNVRLGAGLKDDGKNRITINAARDGGIYVDEDTGEVSCTISSANLNALKVDDMEGHSFFFNPSNVSGEQLPEHVTFLHLGPGLIITTEELPSPEAAVYIMLDSEPDGWSSTYTAYYISVEGGGYTHVTGETAPTWEVGKYYRKSTMVLEKSWLFLTTEPQDWATTYTNYYTKTSSGEYVPVESAESAPEFESGKYWYPTYRAYEPSST